MGKNSYRRSRILGPREQIAYMRAIWRAFDCQVHGGLLVCRGVLKPIDVADSYRVQIDYRVGSPPKVWVEGLPIRDEENPDRRIPHRYGDGSICLYYGTEWTADKPIAQTLVPWLLEWLFFYEGWLATGEWLGGGTHPQIVTQTEAGPG
jgi:hypothetical protein